MGDRFYRAIRFMGRGGLTTNSRLIVHGAQSVPLRGPALIAPNHTSPFDVAMLIWSLSRPIDFVSITELMTRPWVGPFFRRMNAFPLDRQARDVTATRTMIERLRAGRLLCMFPEGRIHSDSPLRRGEVNEKLAQIARVAKVPVIPCVLEGARQSGRPLSWVPTAQTRYLVAFGRAVTGCNEETVTKELREEYQRLFATAAHLPGRD